MKKLFFTILCWPLWLGMVLYYQWIIIWNNVSKIILDRSDRRAIESLIKNSGPYKDKNGKEVYVWLKNIEPEDPKAIGLSFWFELRDVPPPRELKIKHEHGLREEVHGTRNEDGKFDYHVQTSYCFTFLPHFSCRWNLRGLKKYIRENKLEREHRRSA